MLQRFIQFLGLNAIGLTPCLLALAASAGTYQVGVAKIDITPNYSVRLTGYAARKTECEGVAQRLWAKALAIGSDKDHPAILITVDNCGVPRNVRDEVVGRLQKGRGLAPERIAICSTHTHSGPWVEGFAPNIFPAPLSPSEQAHVERYTRELTDALEAVALKALADRKPATLTRGQGMADFAANRRTKGGPVDHALPALFVTGPQGNLRAILASYACHGTTLGGDFNQICGDWPGYAQEYLEAKHPDATVLVALGYAGDANPSPRTGLDYAKQHGRSFARAVDGILTNALSPVEGSLVCRAKAIELPLDKLPTRAEWEAQARQTNYLGAFARLNLARLDRGEKFATTVPYLVQTWTFGNGLAMVFLPGEVVVDYSLRLKREFDPARLWLNAYANDVPCYIPSERILREGGYEGGLAMVYYDRPARLAPGVENLIVSTVHDLVPHAFLAGPTSCGTNQVTSWLPVH